MAVVAVRVSEFVVAKRVDSAESRVRWRWVKGR